MNSLIIVAPYMLLLHSHLHTHSILSPEEIVAIGKWLVILCLISIVLLQIYGIIMRAVRFRKRRNSK